MIPGYTAASYTSTGFLGLSGDGLTAVGYAYKAGTQTPIRWTSQAGFIELPGGKGLAAAISPDGKFVVGSAADQAARWSGATSQTLSKLPNLATSGWTSSARDTSADGSVVVGWSAPSAGGFGAATVWSSAGAQKLADALVAAGVSLTGVELRDGTCVSTNGKIVAANGLSGATSMGFIARLP